MPQRPKRIAIVGGGPTAVYTLKNLVQKADPFHLTIFEAGPVAGCGIPYSEHHNSADMMANITSVEIPPVLVSLADWVRSADAKLLRRFGLNRDEIGERDFYPRILIGAYYVDQLANLAEAAAGSGKTVAIETGTRVLDIKPEQAGFTLFIANEHGKARRKFDLVIMATGHLTDLEKRLPTGGLYRSPYPTQDLQLGPDRAALVLGSSLSAIDAVVALATRYGKFSGDEASLTYETRSVQPLRLVMASRKGIIPDADFYYPIPEEPLLIFTPAQLEALQAQGKTGFLARAMKLFKRQLATDDPDFFARLDIARFTPESFCKAYFALRKARPGFAAIAENLSRSQRDYRDRHTVMWRYTMMRAHEVFSEIVPFLDRKDLARFRRYLTPVFADAYGCVPHLSIARLLALHRAGCLQVVALGDNGRIRYGAGEFRIEGTGNDQSFATLIDARGQEMASISDLGFKRLDQVLETRDFYRRTERQSEDDQFRLPLAEQFSPDIFCLSIPVMMQRYPFAQGLVACSDAATLVAAAL